MRIVLTAFVAALLAGCMSGRTCPSSLPRSGATLQQAALEFIQLTNDHKALERDRTYVADRMKCRHKIRLEDAITKAAGRRIVLVEVMNEWAAGGTTPDGWRRANRAYRKALEVALARAERAMPDASETACTPENNFCNSGNKRFQRKRAVPKSNCDEGEMQ